MTDLISRADAIDALCHNCAYYTDAQCKTDSGYWCESGAMIREDIPSADAVQGEWYQISPARIYECSICNHNVLTDYIDTYNYCPNCGARMKGGDTE